MLAEGAVRFCAIFDFHSEVPRVGVVENQSKNAGVIKVSLRVVVTGDARGIVGARVVASSDATVIVVGVVSAANVIGGEWRSKVVPVGGGCRLGLPAGKFHELLVAANNGENVAADEAVNLGARAELVCFLHRRQIDEFEGEGVPIGGSLDHKYRRGGTLANDADEVVAAAAGVRVGLVPPKVLRELFCDPTGRFAGLLRWGRYRRLLLLRLLLLWLRLLALLLLLLGVDRLLLVVVVLVGCGGVHYGRQGDGLRSGGGGHHVLLVRRGDHTAILRILRGHR